MKKFLAVALSLCTTFLSSLAAQTGDYPSQCGPVLDGATLTFGFECLNDMSMLVTDATSSSWHYSLDSNFDGVAGNALGTSYEIFGMAFREYSEEIWVVINSNMPLSGYASGSATNGSISYGDLFFDLDGFDFASASTNKTLFAVRFAASNDSSAPSLGVYKNVQAKSVTSINQGFASLSAYKQRVTSLGGTPSFGDLPSNQAYYTSALSLNEIASGEYVGPIEFLTDVELAAAGYSGASYAGTQTIAFRFKKGLIIDTCGVVGGDGSSCKDCKGIACGGTKIDLCNICGGDNSSCKDCKGIPNGGAVIDLCGVCGGDNSTCKDCKGVINGTTVIDQCGVCGGDNSSCKDCRGVINGTTKIDACGVCGGDNSTCKDCKGDINGTAKIDVCGVCGGDGKSCLGCDGVPKSGKKNDLCGVCGGDDSTCKDCAGVPNGISKIDSCGVCNGSDNTCRDCAGVPNGSKRVDACGICGGTAVDPSQCITTSQCAGKVDKCGVCNGTNACLDCAGIPNGGTKLDCCGVCGGDGSTCLDKCTFYDLTKTKKRARAAIRKLFSSVRKYSTQEKACNKTSSSIALERINKAKDLADGAEKILTQYLGDKIKSCDTIYCAKQSFGSLLGSLNENTKSLYKLSKQSQYAAGSACKSPKNGLVGSRQSKSDYRSATGAIGQVPNIACVN